MEYDLFGNPIEEKNNLREMFGENPFSILDTKSGQWQARKNQWKKLGIKSEIGRDAKTYHMQDWAKDKGRNVPSDTSIFDPVLCELMYKWYCPSGGAILDPFAGGSVRGIVANYLGFHYTGIDIRQEQVDSNREQALDILEVNNQPQWYVGDSNVVLDNINKELGTTIVMATHDRDIVNRMQKRVIVIEEGRISKDYEKGKYYEVV